MSIPKITITPIDTERNNSVFQGYDVEYFIDNGPGNDDVVISGQLKPFHTGRSQEFNFEPTYFGNEYSEEYHDDNWEDISDEITNELSRRIANNSL